MSFKRNQKYLIESFEEQWTCPITSMPMIDPVSTLDGHSYEKIDIMQWLKKQKTSPKTGLSLSSESLIPNIVLKNVIYKFQNELKYEFEKICTQNQELNQKLQKLQEKGKDIMKEKIKIQNDYKELKSKYSDLLNNSKKVVDSSLQYKKDELILRGQIQGLKEENKSLKVEIKLVQTLKIENKSLKQEFEKVKKQNKFYLLQNQSLIQQRIQSMNSTQKIKQELSILIKQREELKNTLKDQINKYNLQLANKADDNSKLKTDYDQAIMRQNNAREKIDILTQEIQKVRFFKTIADQSIDTQVKQNQKLQALCVKFKTEAKNLANQLIDVNQKLNKIQIQNQKLTNDYSQCLAKLLQKEANISQKQIAPVQKKHKVDQEKMDEEKPSLQSVPRQDFLQNLQPNLNPVLLNAPNKVEQLSKFQKYVRSRSWKTSGASDRLSESLNIMKNALTDVDSEKMILSQNNTSMLNKLKENTESLKNLFSPISVAPKLAEVERKPSYSPEIKPLPLEKINSLPAQNESNAFDSLIRDQAAQKLSKIQENSKKIRHILPFTDYLMNNPVLYDEQKGKLDHSGYKIDMEEFLKHDWSSVKTLNLSDSLLDDKGFELLTNQAIFFQSLNHLWICNLRNIFEGNNLIVNLPKFALERFKNLKTVFFSIKGKFPNPLNEQSKNYLKNFATKNPLITVNYDKKPQSTELY